MLHQRFRAIALTDVKSIYLDHQATTPLDPRVLEAMLPFFTDCFGNPHANTYVQGLNARRAVEDSRLNVAAAIGAKARDIVFTSGATEANNLAILGTAASAPKGARRIVTQSTEHHSVLAPVLSLKHRGFEVVTVGVDRYGIVDLTGLERAIDGDTLLVSVMLVNNETGVIQPLAEIADMCRSVGTLLHCDCAQALGKVAINVDLLDVDMATFSAHKCYGPKGIGALYVKNLRKSRIQPIYFGGGQEGGLRPGTLPVPLCVGFGAAARIAGREQSALAKRAEHLEDQLWRGILKVEPRARLNGHAEYRVSGCISVHFPGARADALIDGFYGIDVSKGSACEATKTRASHVLRAMGCSRAHADATIRMSVGRFTTTDEIQGAISIMRRCYNNSKTGG